MSLPTKRMRSTKPTTCIEDLPPEMISELFKYLGPEDLAACSVVNKRWHSIYAAFKLHRLVLTDSVYHYDPTNQFHKWYGTNQPIQEAELCPPAMFHHLAGKPFLSNFKQLALSGSFEFDLNELNRLCQLVHLEINIDLAGEAHLNLSKLRVLVFHRVNVNCALSIDCPELTTLVYNARNTKLLDVKHPKTIKSLETNLVDLEWLARFKSVECLVARQFNAISKATLVLLPKLRELRFDQDMEYLVRLFHNDVGTVDRVKRTVSEFMDKANKLRGSDFRFTFSGFQLTNVNVDQIDFGVHVDINDYEWLWNEHVYMKNYHLIEPGALSFVRHIDYTSLLRNAVGEFPLCFSQKFTGIESVKVYDVVANADHLLWLLKSQRFLRSLNFIGDTELSQEFYDQLPTSARSLVCLALQVNRNVLHLNFDFISKFPHLSDLMIHPPLSFESFVSLIRSSAKLVNLKFRVSRKEDYRLRIKREKGSTEWKITNFRHELVFEAQNAEEIITFVEEYGA